MNNKLLKSRKAVSPLIATVLLIAFAVALGAVVMNWGRGYVEDTANIARERSDTEVRCASDVDISIVEIDGTPQICVNTSGSPNSRLEFIIENRKSTEVRELEIRLIGDKTRVPYTVKPGSGDTNLTANQARYVNVTYDDTALGELTQVKITPMIRVAGNEVICSQNGETATNIKPCSEIYD